MPVEVDPEIRGEDEGEAPLMLEGGRPHLLCELVEERAFDSGLIYARYRSR